MSTNLVAAVINNNLKEAKKFIETGVNVNQTDSSGNSLLLVSSANGESEMVKLLLDAGADIHAVDSNMKATGGSRSMDRFKHTAHLLTVVQTCRRQGRSVIDFFCTSTAG